MAILFALALVAAACGTDDTGSEGTDATPATTAGTEATTQATTAPTAAPQTTEAPVDEGPKTIIVGTTDSIAGLDSADAYAVHDWELIRNTGEALLSFKPGTTDLTNGIVSDWSVSDDGLVYTFTLRDNVGFGDGTMLTADMYVDHLTRMLTLDGSGGVGDVLGGAFIESYQALDDLTIEITLQDAFGFFPQVVTGAPYMPMHPDFPIDELIEFPEAPIYGVGQWTITDYTVCEQTVLVPNEFYFGGRATNVDQVIIRYFSDAQTMALALENGEIDVAWRTIAQPDLLDQLDTVDGLTVATVPGGSIRYLIINQGLPPTDDINVRKAIALLADRDEIVDRVSAGRWAPLYSPVPPGFIGANEAFDEIYASPDVDAAVALLAESGYTADAPLNLTLNYPPEHYGGTVADTMQVLTEQLEASGVIEVTLNAQEWSTYVGAVIGGEDFNVSLLGWFFDYPDSDNYISPFVLSGGLGTNVTDGDNNPRTDAGAALLDLIKQAATTTDQGDRADLYEQIQAAYAEDVVTIPLWFEAEHVVYWDYVSGDSGAAQAESLNIGPTFDLTYALLQLNK